MRQLQFHLVNTRPICLEDCLPVPGAELPAMQRLMGGTLSEGGEETPPDLRLLPPTRNGLRGMYFDANQGCTLRTPPPVTEMERIILWQRMTLLAVASRVMHGDAIVLLHGCLLKTPSGEGIILCGQSGMGKSTTGKRWIASGGECPADDMMLLEYGGDAFMVHPLPTWSRCVVSLDGEAFPFEDALPVKSIIALNRGTTCEELKETSCAAYLMALYGSCTLFILNTARCMSKEHRDRLMAALKERALFLFGRFPHRALYAHLQSDLRQTLAQAELL